RLPVLRAPGVARHLDLVNALPEPLRDRNRQPLRAAAPLDAVAVLKVALRELHVVEQYEGVRSQHLLEEAEPGHVLRLVYRDEHPAPLLLHAYVDLLQSLYDRSHVAFGDGGVYGQADLPSQHRFGLGEHARVPTEFSLKDRVQVARRVVDGAEFYAVLFEHDSAQAALIDSLFE